MATAYLTQMRQALWNAIDNYTHLEGVFKRQYRAEGKEALKMADLVPGMKDMPAIGIQPSSGNNPWDTNSMTRLSYVCEVWIWTPHWDLLMGEKLIELLIRAFHQATPAGTTQPYVDAAANPWSVGQFSRILRNNEEGIVTHTAWVLPVSLSRQWGPGVETRTLE